MKNDADQTTNEPMAGHFSPENFTIIPNLLLNLVVDGTLKERDLVTYAFFLGRSGAMLATLKQDYSALSERKTGPLLGCSIRTLRQSVGRLAKASVIERRDTPGNTRTRVLLMVENGKVVRRTPVFPARTRRTPPSSDAGEEAA